MRPALAVVIERVVLVVGALLVVAAVATFDWRIGLLVAGLLLVVSTSPWKDLR